MWHLWKLAGLVILSSIEGEEGSNQGKVILSNPILTSYSDYSYSNLNDASDDDNLDFEDYHNFHDFDDKTTMIARIATKLPIIANEAP